MTVLMSDWRVDESAITGPSKTVWARFWPWLSGKFPCNYSLFARLKWTVIVRPKSTNDLRLRLMTCTVIVTVLMSDWRVDEPAMVAATICGMSAQGQSTEII